MLIYNFLIGGFEDMSDDLTYIYENCIIDNWIDEDGLSPDEINYNYEVLSKIMDPLYDYILSYSNYYSTKRDYGLGEKLTMLEVHYLTDIYDNPGITVTQLADSWKRSTAAISRTINKLIRLGYVKRQINVDNAKIFNLFVSDMGAKIALNHKHYDTIDIIKTQKKLLETFSVDELVAFNKVCQKYSQILEDIKEEEEDK